ncbi:MAG: peptidoglycan DD-metalloendopeptidase family protein [Chitinophagaceae bacterium]
MKNSSRLESILKNHQEEYLPVIPFTPGKEKIVHLDLSENNKTFTPEIYNHLPLFSKYISGELERHGAVYGIGGYGELRNMYHLSPLFDANKKNGIRRLHLGIDIWGNAGTPVFAPLGGMVHRFGYNPAKGDYGGTIILIHQLEGVSFYSLYGHLSLDSLGNISEGKYFAAGSLLATTGNEQDNGNWPPHLHFQLIHHFYNSVADYPGVCAEGEKNTWLSNSPDPDLILKLMRYAIKT